MKKNHAMRLASILAILVLSTTSIIGGTFAKYVTSGSSTDTARVAKWGVKIAATSTDTAFKTTYAAKDDPAYAGIATTVESSDYVLAPGTSGKLAGFKITGTPEVACEVTFAATLTLTGWEVGDNPYIPLIFKVTIDDNGTDKTTTIDGAACSSLNDFVTKVQNAIGTTKYAFEPNTDLSTEATTMSVSWEWPFEVNDEKDTALGNLATAPTVKLVVDATVTQLD